jgi:hypothetical protein
MAAVVSLLRQAQVVGVMETSQQAPGFSAMPKLAAEK